MIKNKYELSELIEIAIKSLNNSINVEINIDELEKNHGDLYDTEIVNKCIICSKVIEDDKKIYDCQFWGFSEEVIKRFKANEKDSFIKYFLDHMFLSYKRDKEIFNDIDVRDYLITKVRAFINDRLNQYQEPINMKTDFYDALNEISKLNYEGKSISAKLLILNKDFKDENILSFKKEIEYEKHRKIRKLLEVSDSKMCLIGNSSCIYGIANLNDIKHKDINGYAINFKGKYNYEIKKIYKAKGKIVEELILHILYGAPTFKLDKYSEVELDQVLREIFIKHKSLELNNFEDELKTEIELPSAEMKDNINKMKEIVRYASKQDKGTIIVITSNDLAERETEELECQSNSIRKTSLRRKSGDELKAMIKNITSIDGAVYLDIEGNCHAIGVILDGGANNKIGDDSRGARFNSALKYHEKIKDEHNSVIVVISEDHMVDIIPSVDDLQEKKNKQWNEFFEIISKNDFKRLYGVDLEEECQCNLDSYYSNNKGISYKELEQRYYQELKEAAEINLKEIDYKEIEQMGYDEIEKIRYEEIDYTELYHEVGMEEAYSYEVNKGKELINNVIQIEGKSKTVYDCAAMLYKDIDVNIALNFIDKAIEIGTENSSVKSLAYSYFISGMLYSKEENYNDSKRQLSTALYYIEGHKDKIVKSFYNAHLAKVYCKLGQYNDAEEYFNKAIDLNPKEIIFYEELVAVYKELLEIECYNNTEYQKEIEYLINKKEELKLLYEDEVLKFINDSDFNKEHNCEEKSIEVKQDNLKEFEIFDQYKDVVMRWYR